ncbi:MAG: mechanosensitive ion channel family protein [Oligoflexia bacterium]|nr:mechanosensitive ion channel family protein [Oligoflexia bacterium]
MIKEINVFLIEHRLAFLVPWFESIIIFLFSLFILLNAQRFLWKQLEKLVKKTKISWDDDLVDATKNPSRLFFATLALIITYKFSPHLFYKNSIFIILIKDLLVLSIVWPIDRIFRLIINKSELLRSSGENLKDLLTLIGRIFIFLVAFLVILESSGISITPILASLGVGSVAIALALQDTLSNFFSGVYTLIDKPIRAGDYIKIDGLVEGIVLKIGWRSTRIQLLSDNIVIMPNNKMASAIVTNYDLITHETGVTVSLMVGLEADLCEVEKITLEVAKEIQNSATGAVKNYEPSLRYSSFSEFGMNFNVYLKAQKVIDQYAIKHEFFKKISAVYKEKGISIPYPHRNIHMIEKNQR